MKIYYAASIWGAPGDENFNLEIIDYMKRFGTVLSEQLFLPDYRKKEHLDTEMIHDRDIAWVNEADRVVAECSAASLGVGYEIREGVIRGKPILALYRVQEKRLSGMIDGCKKGIKVCTYRNIEEAKKGIDLFF